MKISIIVPVYNVEDYVTECLNSIKSLSINNEIIVVNDGSKDKSLDKVNEFAETFDGEIKVISKENGGLSSVRNAGIEQSSGDYIFFLDSDDYIDKLLFELFVNDVINDGVDIGFADYCYLKNGRIEANNEATYRKKVAARNNDVVDGFTYGNRFFDKTHNFFNVEACFILTKKSLLIDNNIRFMQGVYHEDTLFTLTCLMVAKKARYYDYPFYVYRMREDSIMHTPNPNTIDKKFQDKGTIALALYELKESYKISAIFIDTLIVDLLLISIMHFRKKTPITKRILSRCMNITIKTKIRVALYKLLSLRYV